LGENEVERGGKRPFEKTKKRKRIKSGDGEKKNQIAQSGKKRRRKG